MHVGRTTLIILAVITLAGGGLRAYHAANPGLERQSPDEQSYAAAVAELVQDQVASKIAAQDPTLWGADAESEAAKRLSWVRLADSSRQLIAEITALREQLQADGVDHVVLAGMGGSSLAPEVICATAGAKKAPNGDPSKAGNADRAGAPA